MVALFAQQSNIVEFPQPQGKNEWYTPARYIEAAREVMGEIDLDPASCELANRTVKATRFYTAKENGLAQEWHGNVWLNPPYGVMKTDTPSRNPNLGKSYIGLFLGKLIQSYSDGQVEQAVMLCRADPSAYWFASLWDYLICFCPYNFYFNAPGGGKVKHRFGSVFIYMGKNEQKFIETFEKFGTVARRVSSPKVQPVNLSLWEVQ